MSIECVERAEQTEAGGEIAGAAADFQDAVGRADAERLQNASLKLGSQHGLAESDGYGRIGECQLTILRRHEGFARHRGQHIEHARVENLPGAYLLIHHLLTSGQRIHDFSR